MMFQKSKVINKRAQLAIFMILGITVVVLIGLGLYGASNADTGYLNSKQKQIEELFIGKGKYTTYIKSCLDQATKQGLYLVGQQGGVIYETDNYGDASLIEAGNTGNLEIIGGSTSKAFYETNDGLKIHYGLMAPQVSTTEENGMLKYPFLTLPDQPFLGISAEETYGNPYPFFDNINNPLIRLCDKYGPNSFGDQGIECGSGPYMYDSPAIENHNSVQEYLQYYITQKTDECIKLDALPELQGYDVQKENVDVKVVLGKSSVISKLNMNLSITKNETLPKIEISDITIEKDVRLLKIFQTLQDIIINDYRNIFYDLKNIQTCGSVPVGEPCLSTNMIIEKNQISSGPNAGDWIVGVTDTNSLIDGQEYTYQVVFQNRYPALDYIALDGVELNPSFSDYDAIVVQGQKLIIHPYGYDPDEDNHGQEGYMKNSYTYEYIGDYFEFDSDPNDLGDPVCTPSNSASLALMKTKIDSCSSAASLPSAFDSNNIFELDIKEKHAGERNIKVSVCDLLNQCDYQILKIFIIPMSTHAANDGSIPDYNYNLHTFAGKKPYLTDPGQTITLGINNAAAVSSEYSQPVVEDFATSNGLITLNGQQYSTQELNGDVDGTAYSIVVTNEESGVSIYYDNTGMAVAYSTDGEIIKFSFDEQTEEEQQYYELAESLQIFVISFQQESTQPGDEEGISDDVIIDEPQPDKKMIVVVDNGATKDHHQVYLVANDDLEYPEIYVITPDYDGLVVPGGYIVPDDDGLKNSLKTNLNLIKYVFTQPSNQKVNNYILYHFYNDYVCLDGAFYSDYCVLGNGCYYNLNIKLTNDNVAIDNYNQIFCEADESCCATGCCS